MNIRKWRQLCRSVPSQDWSDLGWIFFWLFILTHGEPSLLEAIIQRVLV